MKWGGQNEKKDWCPCSDGEACSTDYGGVSKDLWHPGESWEHGYFFGRLWGCYVACSGWCD